MVWKLKTLGYSERTLKGYSKRLRMLARNTNINNPESVKSYISCRSWSNAYKEGVVNFRSDDYTSVAKDINEAQKLVESGFEYVTTFDSLMLFRKRK